ncbi:NAD(P)/FAD-dependent oxidoreductase [Actinomycetota bacterium]
MAITASGQRVPEHVVIVGAGIVGLATAFFLQERGVQVTVLDKEGVAAGASWGNAGWLTPGLAAPLPEPAVLAYGIRAVVSPASPVYVPPAADVALARFVTGFLRHSTAGAWERGLAKLVPLNNIALESFDALHAGGVNAETREAPFVAAFSMPGAEELLVHEVETMSRLGLDVECEVVSGEEARRREPMLSEHVHTGVLLNRQRYIDPGAYVHSLADAVVARGATLDTSAEVVDVRETDSRAEVLTADGRIIGADALVLATGAWLGRLLRRVGSRKIVQAGRGYSFTVDAEAVPDGPVYLPEARVAITPIQGAVRIAGMMEFRRPDAPLDPRRVDAIAAAAKPFVRGVDVEARRDEWVGSRPVTIDGLPLIGVTKAPRVYAAGGHGMWGVTLGPATGRLLAEQIVTGRHSPILQPFSPLR